MNIGIDIQSLQTDSRRAGIGRYILNLIANLRKVDRENRYFFFLTEAYPLIEDLLVVTGEESRCYFKEYPSLGKYA